MHKHWNMICFDFLRCKFFWHGVWRTNQNTSHTSYLWVHLTFVYPHWFVCKWAAWTYVNPSVSSRPALSLWVITGRGLLTLPRGRWLPSTWVYVDFEAQTGDVLVSGKRTGLLGAVAYTARGSAVRSVLLVKGCIELCHGRHVPLCALTF